MHGTSRTNFPYLFKPRSIAILGASADLAKVSGRPLSYMLRFGYPGKIYPINPKHKEIAGVPCFPTLEAVPSEIDLLLVIIPAKEILANLEVGWRKGARAAVIISGGFAEVGEEGRKLQQELTEFATRTGMLLYGPNTTGFLSLIHRTVATFTQSLEVTRELIPGKTGLITQSGAFGATIFVRAMRHGLGLSHWAATGNEADLEFCDFLEYMATDPETQVIAGFLAGVEDGAKFTRALDLAAKNNKPVVLLKVGGTEASKRAAYSHTGAIVGSSRVYDALFKQKGVVVAEDVPQLIDYSLAFSMTRPPKGRRVGILTESGGGGILLTERCSEVGLQVSEIIGATRDKLSVVVPALGSVKNPVDLTGQSLTDPSLVKSAAAVMLDSDDFDIVIPMLLMSEATAERKATDLVALLDKPQSQKCAVVCWPEGPAAWVRFLTDHGIHVSATATSCAQTLAAMTNFADFQRRLKSRAAFSAAVSLPADRVERVTQILRAAAARGDRHLGEYEAKKILRAYGVPTSEEQLVQSSAEALKAASRIGYPVAAKLVSPDIPHKTEAGVIALNIKTADELTAAYQVILDRGKAYRSDARVEGVLVQEMVRGTGVETIIGLSREAPFGPAMLFGLGGVFVEVLKDVSIRLTPVDAGEVNDMIEQIRGYPLLGGFRGRKPADLAALADILGRVSRLSEEWDPVIVEADINPVIVLEEGKGAKAVDALFSLNLEALAAR